MSTVGEAPEIVRVAERALLVRFPDPDLSRAVARAHALAARFRHAADSSEPFGNRDQDEKEHRDEDRDQDHDQDERLSVKGEWILGAGNLLVRFDDSSAVRDVEAFADRLSEVARVFPFNECFSTDRTHSFTVCFGQENGPDLRAVARDTGIAEAEVVARFCSVEYVVAFVGFSPGFPYLIGLPRELEVPRLASPRATVPAGSVAIAGPFAGVYPSATPGGWRLLGRTEARLFAPDADPPARLAPGDRVRFVAS